ncbi:hypothetical protein RFI_21710 [Reticulomyxa filosa]|uniref:Uncharacterized protein n=1 Tax=Reticulomyxa filosa TaxID=46433 RepID=X6MP63_RETFI|nr:hypothetical protein RFI_21710 [Reticulomyxa filosa]|eukprot:ETO15654.1 hypothetical protein RFI_21710 [Reticulomyxa filosa]
MSDLLDLSEETDQSAEILANSSLLYGKEKKHKNKSKNEKQNGKKFSKNNLNSTGSKSPQTSKSQVKEGKMNTQSIPSKELDVESPQGAIFNLQKDELSEEFKNLNINKESKLNATDSAVNNDITALSLSQNISESFETLLAQIQKMDHSKPSSKESTQSPKQQSPHCTRAIAETTKKLNDLYNFGLKNSNKKSEKKSNVASQMKNEFTDKNQQALFETMEPVTNRVISESPAKKQRQDNTKGNKSNVVDLKDINNGKAADITVEEKKIVIEESNFVSLENLDLYIHNALSSALHTYQSKLSNTCPPLVTSNISDGDFCPKSNNPPLLNPSLVNAETSCKTQTNHCNVNQSQVRTMDNEFLDIPIPVDHRTKLWNHKLEWNINLIKSKKCMIGGDLARACCETTRLEKMLSEQKLFLQNSFFWNTENHKIADFLNDSCLSSRTTGVKNKPNVFDALHAQAQTLRRFQTNNKQIPKNYGLPSNDRGSQQIIEEEFVNALEEYVLAGVKNKFKTEFEIDEVDVLKGYLPKLWNIILRYARYHENSSRTITFANFSKHVALVLYRDYFLVLCRSYCKFLEGLLQPSSNDDVTVIQCMDLHVYAYLIYAWQKPPCIVQQQIL